MIFETLGEEGRLLCGEKGLLPLDTAESFSNPYDTVGKCYIDKINYTSGNEQWLSRNRILITPISPLHPLVSSPIFYIGEKPLRTDVLAIVVGIEPVTYKATSGEIINPVSFRVLNYFPKDFHVKVSPIPWIQAHVRPYEIYHYTPTVYPSYFAPNF